MKMLKLNPLGAETGSEVSQNALLALSLSVGRALMLSYQTLA